MHHRLSPWLVALSFTLGQAPSGWAQDGTKMVAAGPEDILSGRVRLPRPETVVNRSRVGWHAARFRGEGAVASFELTLELAADETITCVPFGAGHSSWTLDWVDPSGREHPPEALQAAGRLASVFGDYPGLGGAVPVEGRLFTPATSGNWTLRVKAPKAAATSNAWVLVARDTELRLDSHLSTYRLTSDAPLGIVASLASSDESLDPAVLSGGVERAWLTVETPRGRQTVALHDDGGHDDGVAGDGRFGGRLPAGLSGRVAVVTSFAGRDAQGQPFHLSTHHAFPVLEPDVALTGLVSARERAAGLVALDIETWDARAARRHVSAEVWGRDLGGASVPVCWLSRLVAPAESASGLSRYTLELDERWWQRSGAVSGLELRELRVQDIDTHVVLDRRARLDVEGFEPRTASGASDAGLRTEITTEMLTGVRTLSGGTGSALGGALDRGPQRNRALVLSHGYCSGGTPWPNADFDLPRLVFVDPDANRSHDEFATRIRDFAASRTDSFGIVGHSQGGAAALHLYTYYFSGLDLASFGRRIQSLATPYQGTPLASLGFFACGTNFDLTPDGAALWLAGIPTWAREEVHYWTTEDGGSACNFFTGLLLADPNDGTTERFRGQLPGANSEGHVSGWCHTTGMSFPAAYFDASRNDEMNQRAAR